MTLDGIPSSINDAGNVVVGERNGLPVFWVRNATTLAWIGTGVALPSISGTSCGPYGVDRGGCERLRHHRRHQL